MEPDSLSFLTLITKLRVIPCSAFGVRRSAVWGVLQIPLLPSTGSAGRHVLLLFDQRVWLSVSPEVSR